MNNSEYNESFLIGAGNWSFYKLITQIKFFNSNFIKKTNKNYFFFNIYIKKKTVVLTNIINCHLSYSVTVESYWIIVNFFISLLVMLHYVVHGLIKVIHLILLK